MSYRPRRLRAPRPVTVLAYTGHPPRPSHEDAMEIRRAWLAGARKGVVVLDGRDWAVSEVRR